MTHKKYCYFNVLLYLTSHILTECENTTVTENRGNNRVKSVTSRSSFILVNIIDGGLVSRSGSFICVTRRKVDYVSFCSDLQDFDEIKAHFSCLMSKIHQLPCQ